MLKKIDLRKELRHLYLPSAKQVELVRVPKFNFAMVDGQIEAGQAPGTSQAFKDGLEALYGVSYTLKFMLKKRKTHAVDYPVMALEGLWWVEDGIFDIRVKDKWHYTLMILQPEIITQDVFEQGRAEVRRKRGDSTALSGLRLPLAQRPRAPQKALHPGLLCCRPFRPQHGGAFHDNKRICATRH